jgi:hypothetical protein
MKRAMTVGLALAAIVLLSVAIALGNIVIALLATGPLLLIIGSAAGTGPIAGQARQFEGQTVRLRIWGMEPRQVNGAPILVKRVWPLGAGLHLSATKRDGPGMLHIKVAQPRRWSSSAGVLTVADAKYVQISGATVPSVPGTLALEVLLEERGRSPG